MHELRLLAAEECIDALSDALLSELDALSVSVENAAADTADEEALFGEPGLPTERSGWQRSIVKALFDDEARATAAAAWLLAQALPQVQLEAIAALPDEDWVRLTQSQFLPVEITPTFWVVPSWHEKPPGAERVIRLDPGLAFGTGTHPTTRMCLRWIARRASERPAGWPRVLDYGCGSGILAIGAALHGALCVDALDIDAAAIAAARANAERNGVVLHAGTPDAARGGYALVLANILAKPLELLAPLLASQLAPEGELVLAGILERQAQALHAAYAAWCALDIADREDGWILMTARRAA